MLAHLQQQGRPLICSPQPIIKQEALIVPQESKSERGSQLLTVLVCFVIAIARVKAHSGIKLNPDKATAHRAAAVRVVTIIAGRSTIAIARDSTLAIIAHRVAIVVTVIGDTVNIATTRRIRLVARAAPAKGSVVSNCH